MSLQETQTYMFVITFSTEKGELPTNERVAQLVGDRLDGILDDDTGLTCIAVSLNVFTGWDTADGAHPSFSRKTNSKTTVGYDEGHMIGAAMRQLREDGDYSYDCRYDLADAAKQPGDYFAQFKKGLEDGLG